MNGHVGDREPWMMFLLDVVGSGRHKVGVAVCRLHAGVRGHSFLGKAIFGTGGGAAASSSSVWTFFSLLVELKLRSCLW